MLDLCANHTYDEALEIIARPRPEGLQLKTSYSALCRFYCSHSAEAREAAVLDQAAASLQFIRQKSSGSLRTAILATVENRIFAALRSGKTVAELKDDFAALKDLHKGFLAEEKWRRDPEVDAREEYSIHRSCSSIDEHYDFVPCDPNGQPTDIPPLSDDEINRLNETDEITSEDIADLDYQIAAFGPVTAERTASLIQGYPPALVQQRIEAYQKSLQTRGVTPVQAALEARRTKLQSGAAVPAAPASVPLALLKTASPGDSFAELDENSNVSPEFNHKKPSQKRLKCP